MIKYIVEQPKEEVKELNLVEKLKQKIDEKINYQYTDIVGDMPTKFKYTKVKDDDFGLTDEMLLYLDDKTLSKYIPLKGIVPYREQEYKLNKFLLKKDGKIISKEIERAKNLITGDIQQKQENMELNKKLLGKKKYLSKDEEREKRRLESYGIVEEEVNKKK